MGDDKRVILCIDDDPDILEYLKILLTSEGYEFAGADSAEEGLRVYNEVDPEIVIVDLMMEEVDAGAEFVRELQLLGNEAPVFMLSSVGDDLSMSTDYTSLGLAGVFQKPLSRERLLPVLKARLHPRQQ
jgi:DNA-binding response OmpR family regulator